MAEKSGKFVLEAPLDASGIKDFKPDRPVKVVAYNRSGAVASSAVAELNEKGQGHATLAFEGNPGGVRVVVGPESASEDDLKHLQTLTVDVPPAMERGKHPSPIARRHIPVLLGLVASVVSGLHDHRPPALRRRQPCPGRDGVRL